MRCFNRTGKMNSRRSCRVAVSAFHFAFNNYRLLRTDVNEDEDHRYLMFSATFNKECRKLAREYLSTDHIRVRVGRPGSSHLNVSQVVSSLTSTTLPLSNIADHSDPLRGRPGKETCSLRSASEHGSYPHLNFREQQDHCRLSG